MYIPKGNFINGKWLSSDDAQLTIYNKYDLNQISLLPYASKEQVLLAISSAQEAYDKYKFSSQEEKQNLLLALADKLKEQKAFFAALISEESGKPITYARAEVERSISTLWNSAVNATMHNGEMIPMDYGLGKGKLAYTKKFPIGPIIAISPFNFPLNLALHKIAPALAVGCSVVIKPSEYTPLSLLAFAKVFEDVGGPKGLLNIVNCQITEAELLVRSATFKMLSFTGSPEVGWHLKNIAGKKKVTLELGGNAGVYIDADADIEEVAKKCAIGSFLYAGQICISTQRIYVHESIYDDFILILKKESEKLPVGDPSHEKTIVGPLIDKSHLERIHKWVRESIDLGAQLISGGKIKSEVNNLYAPTILTNVPETAKLNCEEVFGPVVVVEKVTDYKEGVNRINNSRYGLQSGIFVNDIHKMNWIVQHLEVGGIIFNNVPAFRLDTMPYGGIKDSGLGREGIKYAMDEMTESKLVVY